MEVRPGPPGGFPLFRCKNPLGFPERTGGTIGSEQRGRDSCVAHNQQRPKTSGPVSPPGPTAPLLHCLDASIHATHTLSARTIIGTSWSTCTDTSEVSLSSCFWFWDRDVRERKLAAIRHRCSTNRWLHQWRISRQQHRRSPRVAAETPWMIFPCFPASCRRWASARIRRIAN